MQVVAWGFFVVFSAMDLQETEHDRDSWTHVSDFGFGQVSEPDASYYEPSIRSDFSRFLPVFTTDGCEPLAADYDADRVVQSAWKSLPNTELELHWEKDFWSRFLDPNVSALDMMTRGIKRPMPVPDVTASSSSVATDVERRVASNQTVEVKNFLQHIPGGRSVRPSGKWLSGDGLH